MVGEAVVHSRYGLGRVTAFKPPRIEIAFDSGDSRTFAYPLSVDRFIHFERDEAQHRAERDREQAAVLEQEQAIEKLLQLRQRAEETAREHVEALREKKAAAARRTAARRKEKATEGGESK